MLAWPAVVLAIVRALRTRSVRASDEIREPEAESNADAVGSKRATKPQDSETSSFIGPHIHMHMR